MQKSGYEQQFFIPGTQVEVTSIQEGFTNSWYKCTIIRPPKSKKSSQCNKLKKKENFYWVEYENIIEEYEYSIPFREYVHSSFIRPLPPTSSACIKNFDKFDIVEANYRGGWWIGVINEVINDGFEYLVAFVSPYDEIVFRRDDLRPHLTWLGENRWIRLHKKDYVCCIEDGNETVEHVQFISVPAAGVSAMEMTASPAKRQEPGTSDDAERRRSLGWGRWEDAVQALEAPPPLHQSCRLSLSESNTNCERKMKVSDRDGRCSLFLGPENGGNEKNDGRVWPRKEAIQRFLNSIQLGQELGESSVEHESANGQSPTSDTTDSVCSCRTREVQVTGIEDKITNVDDEQGECQSKTLLLYSDHHELTKSPNPRPASHVVNPQSDHSQRWPFTKRSKMWETIESMEVFKTMPQMPHFSTLNEHNEDSRESFAISMMIKFAYVAERLTSGSPDDLQRANIIDDSLDSLKELESHGFSTAGLQGYLNELLEKTHKEKGLRENLEEVESGIEKCLGEKTDCEITLSKLVEQMKSLQDRIESEKSVKNLKEQQIAKSESEKDIILRELHNLQLTKKIAFEW